MTKKLALVSTLLGGLTSGSDQPNSRSSRDSRFTVLSGVLKVTNEVTLGEFW
jgi:hypothetical protein